MTTSLADCPPRRAGRSLSLTRGCFCPRR